MNLTSEGNWPQRKWGVVTQSTGNGCFESEKITTAFWREDKITETKRSLRDHLKVLSLISKQAPMSQPGGYSRDSFVELWGGCSLETMLSGLCFNPVWLDLESQISETN